MHEMNDNILINSEWWAKAAVREKTRGRAGGGHLVGIRKSMCEKCRMEEWLYEMIMKIDRRREAKKLWIIEVYNNDGFKQIEKLLREHVQEGMEACAAVVIAGDLNARIG